MAKFYPELNDALIQFIAEQKLFFVATAPTQGRINLSPKGLDTFRCLDNKTVAYLDLTGSGNETAAHLLDDGRMTMMFCSFSDKPLILRLYGQGRPVRHRDADWESLYSHFEPRQGARQIILLEIESVQTSCGFGVPVYEFQRTRNDLPRFIANQGEDGLLAYQKKHNQVSIDGLPTYLLSD